MPRDQILMLLLAVLLVCCGIGGLGRSIYKQKASKKSSGVFAQNNSVAIGNDNTGNINLVTTNTNYTVKQNDNEKNSLLTFWNILCGFATLAGLYIGVKAL